jgi:hypothetical protein
MADTIRHTVKLKRGTIELLKAILAQHTWYKDTPNMLLRACYILEAPICTGQKPPECPYSVKDYLESDERKATFAALQRDWGSEVLKPWEDEEVEHELTEKERECVKACLRWFLKEARLDASRFTLNALTQFGLAEE